jgi:hypothetical protein
VNRVVGVQRARMENELSERRRFKRILSKIVHPFFIAQVGKSLRRKGKIIMELLSIGG